MPPAIQYWHAQRVVYGIGHDLPDSFPPLDRRLLQEWIIAHYDEPGAALGSGDSRLPVALAAVRTAEEKIVLERDMGTEPVELRARLSRAMLAGASGDQRRARLQRLFSILEERGIALPEGIEALLPYWGLEDLLFCAVVFPGEASTVAHAWLERHLPHLAGLHAALVQAAPPPGHGAQYAWAAVRLEAASRFLLLRAAAQKPLWQDPYGARHLVNRELLPLWRTIKPPADLVTALIDEAVLGTDLPRQASDRVREHLSGKLLSAVP